MIHLKSIDFGLSNGAVDYSKKLKFSERTLVYIEDTKYVDIFYDIINKQTDVKMCSMGLAGLRAQYEFNKGNVIDGARLFLVNALEKEGSPEEYIKALDNLLKVYTNVQILLLSNSMTVYKDWADYISNPYTGSLLSARTAGIDKKLMKDIDKLHKGISERMTFFRLYDDNKEELVELDRWYKDKEDKGSLVEYKITADAENNLYGLTLRLTSFIRDYILPSSKDFVKCQGIFCNREGKENERVLLAPDRVKDEYILEYLWYKANTGSGKQLNAYEYFIDNGELVKESFWKAYKDKYYISYNGGSLYRREYRHWKPEERGDKIKGVSVEYDLRKLFTDDEMLKRYDEEAQIDKLLGRFMKMDSRPDYHPGYDDDYWSDFRGYIRLNYEYTYNKLDSDVNISLHREDLEIGGNVLPTVVADASLNSGKNFALWLEHNKKKQLAAIKEKIAKFGRGSEDYYKFIKSEFKDNKAVFQCLYHKDYNKFASLIRSIAENRGEEYSKDLKEHNEKLLESRKYIGGACYKGYKIKRIKINSSLLESGPWNSKVPHDIAKYISNVEVVVYRESSMRIKVRLNTDKEELTSSESEYFKKNNDDIVNWIREMLYSLEYDDIFGNWHILKSNNKLSLKNLRGTDEDKEKLTKCFVLEFKIVPGGRTGNELQVSLRKTIGSEIDAVLAEYGLGWTVFDTDGNVIEFITPELETYGDIEERIEKFWGYAD